MTIDVGSITDLGDFSISAAGVQVGTSIVFSSLISSVTLNARLAYGSGGTTIIGIVQTSLDQGTTWVDIARFDFAVAGLEKVMTLTNASVTSPYTVVSTSPINGSGGLGSEGTINGILGDRLRVIVTSTGTYTGSTLLSIRAAVR